jgi:hypothetical protein
MTLDDLIQMCRARLVQLSQLRSSAVALGDTDQVASIDAQAAETQTTLNQLLTLGG